MCRAQIVMALVAWFVGVAHSWDFAVSVGDQLIFYTNDGKKTDTVNLRYRNLAGLAYDEVHNLMLYVDKQDNNDAICGYYISSKENKCFVERNGRNIDSIAYDPATEKIFFTDTIEKSINWISLKRGYYASTYGNRLFKLQGQCPTDIAVDSCRGYIYWSNGKNIERARLNGSRREAIFKKHKFTEFYSLAIEPNIQKLYYIDGFTSDNSGYVNTADLDGKNEMPKSINAKGKNMAVSKDYIYWITNYKTIWRLRKHDYHLEQPTELYMYSALGIAANYKIADQIKGINDCDSLSSLIPTLTVACNNYCFQGTCSVNDDGYPSCSCNAGYSGKTCEIDACHDYCMHGNCSHGDDGYPTCSCNAGYTGLSCEVSACYGDCSNNGDCSLNENSEPVCQCKEDYSGDRCEVSHCLNYCLHGNCSLSDEGHPTCSCNPGYAGLRCEVSACHGYCLNNGDCSLNENSEPICQCEGDYSGDRCEVSPCQNYCMYGNCTLSDEGHPTCSCNPGYVGLRCAISACHGYCLNNGDCSLNEISEPICQCEGDYSGDRCEVSPCQNYCLYGNCSLSDEGHQACSCDAGYSGERCEVSACHGYCLNDGECSLNEEDEPVCQCVDNYDGLRCEADISSTC